MVLCDLVRPVRSDHTLDFWQPMPEDEERRERLRNVARGYER